MTIATARTGRCGRQFFWALACFAGAAFADGVPLITAGKLVAPGVEGENPDFVRTRAAVVNKDAFLANVVTVTIDDKVYRFVGGPVPRPVARALPQVAAAASAMAATATLDASQAAPSLQPLPEVWTGTTGSYDKGDNGTLTMVRDEKGEIFGGFDLPPARGFMFLSRRQVLIERDRNRSQFRIEFVTPGVTPGVPK